MTRFNTEKMRQAKERSSNPCLDKHFNVVISLHTLGADHILTDPETVREIIAKGIEQKNLQEEIDFTLQVRRLYLAP